MAKIGKDVIRIPAKTYRIPAKTYKMKRKGRTIVIHRKAQTIHRKGHEREDTGKSGKTPESEKWFEPQKHRGWRKEMSAKKRRAVLLSSTDKRRSLHDRYVEAGRAIQALANVTTDRETRKKAKADAEYFFGKTGK